MNYFVLVTLISAASAYERTYSYDGSFRNETLMDIYTATFEGEEPGSGGEGGTPGCEMHYVVFNNKFLRGVTGDDHESYNGTSYKKCAELCCMETRFKCQSFTHMKILRQCFIMNSTREDPRFDLDDALGYVHVQLVELQTTTTTTTTTFKTPAFTTTRRPSPTPDSPIDKEPPFETPDNPARIVQTPLCSQECLNGGTCKLQTIDGILESYCKCKEGYKGTHCGEESTEPVAAAGFPMWIIAIIVIAAVLLILLIIVCVICQIQKKKTGQYRVFSALREWARKVRRPKKAVSSEDFFHGGDPYNQPIKNTSTLYDTIGSHGHSTSTSV